MPTLDIQKLPRRRHKPVGELTEKFIGEVAPTLATSSVLCVTRSLFSMRKSLAGKQPTTELLMHWLRRRLSVDRVSPATLALERCYANRFFEWAMERGFYDKNPLRGIPRVPVRIVNKPEIKEADLTRLIQASPDWAVFLQLAWITGARAIDLCNLTWGNFEPAGRTGEEQYVLTFTPVKTIKSGREVVIVLPASISAGLLSREQILPSDNHTPTIAWPVFPLQKQLHSRGDGSFQRAFTGVCKKAGLESHITFHCFRHTRARRMLTGPNKVTPLVAADVLGLVNMNTLRRYSPASAEEKARAVTL